MLIWSYFIIFLYTDFEKKSPKYRNSTLPWVKVQNYQYPELSKISILKLAVCPLNIHNVKIKWSIVLRETENKLKSEKLIYKCNRLNSALWGWLSVVSHPHNPEFRNIPEIFRKLSPMHYRPEKWFDKQFSSCWNSSYCIFFHSTTLSFPWIHFVSTPFS